MGVVDGSQPPLARPGPTPGSHLNSPCRPTTPNFLHLPFPELQEAQPVRALLRALHVLGL